MTTYLVDTNVFLYARGREHPYRSACRSVLRAAQLRRIALEASVELVQEFAHVLLRRGAERPAALREADEVAAQCRLHDFDVGVLGDAVRLLRHHDGLGCRDAIHAATALRAGLVQVVTADRALAGVGGLERVDPLDLARELVEH